MKRSRSRRTAQLKDAPVEIQLTKVVCAICGSNSGSFCEMLSRPEGLSGSWGFVCLACLRYWMHGENWHEIRLRSRSTVPTVSEIREDAKSTDGKATSLPMIPPQS